MTSRTSRNDHSNIPVKQGITTPKGLNMWIEVRPAEPVRMIVTNFEYKVKSQNLVTPVSDKGPVSSPSKSRVTLAIRQRRFT